MNKGLVNRNEFRVVGMSRSGNHAIINWILAGARGRTCFLNCVEPRLNPFHSARPIEGEVCHRANYPDFDLAGEQAGRFTPKDYLVYSYEDCFLRPLVAPEFRRAHDAFVGSSGRQVNILILRDPYNLFASRMKFMLYTQDHYYYHPVGLATALRIWKQHAREFVGERHLLGPDRVLVSYNRWAADPGYRRRIALELGIECADDGLDEVPSTGGGSSFDGLEYQGRAARMDVLGRWKHYAGDPEYRGLFDAEVRRLSRAAFGPIPGTDSLFDDAAAV